MKRLFVVIMMALLTTSTLTGCYGKFALTKKVYDLNGQVSDKFLRSGLTWVFIIIPVYKIAALVDFIAFNTIEFWSGNNPVASGEKDFQFVKDDDRFDIHAVKKGDKVSYDIKHYHGDRYVDSVNLNWNVKTGDSVALHKEFAKTTEYMTKATDDGVQVKTFARGIFNKKLEHVALYK